MLWRNRCKGQCIGYAGEVVRADPYSYIPEDPARSLHLPPTASACRQACLGQPDMFAQQNAAGLALTVADPVLVDDLGLLGAVINLWEILAGGIPPPPPEADPEVGRRPEEEPPCLTPRLPPTLTQGELYYKLLAVRTQLALHETDAQLGVARAELAPRAITRRSSRGCPRSRRRPSPTWARRPGARFNWATFGYDDPPAARAAAAVDQE